MSNSETKEEKAGFKVRDRRIFTSEGSVRTDLEAEIEPEQTSQPKAPETPESESERREKEPAAQPKEPEEAMNFSSLLLFLATTGMVHLGEIPEPTTGHRSENLEGARQMIDLLTILMEKTEGNLTAEEARLLENLLYELRMKFMDKSKVVKL